MLGKATEIIIVYGFQFSLLLHAAMSHLHNKLQNHNNIDLVWHREVVFENRLDNLS